MARRAKWPFAACLPRRRSSDAPGFLLVEATLAVVVIAVGLVLVSRSIAASLTALTRLQTTHRLLDAAESTLHELEARASVGLPMPRSGAGGAFPDRYRWELSVEPMTDVEDETIGEDETIAEAFDAVTLTVNAESTRRGALRLRTLWPKEWLKE